MQERAPDPMATTSAPLAPAEFAGEGEIKRRLRGYFMKYPQKTFTKKQLNEHFNDVTEFNLSYHLNGLKTQGVIFSEKRGCYQFNKKWQSMAEKRAAVEAHIEENPRVIQDGTPFIATKPALSIVENPSAAADLVHLMCASLLERLGDKCVAADREFIELLRDRAYPRPLKKP